MCVDVSVWWVCVWCMCEGLWYVGCVRLGIGCGVGCNVWWLYGIEKYLKNNKNVISFYITCTQILFLWLVESRSLFQLFIAPGDKTSYCNVFWSANVQKLLTFALSIHIFFSVQNFPYNLRTFAVRMRLIRKIKRETLREENAASARVILQRRVGRLACV